MSSQAGSVRPLCHVSRPQPLHTHAHTHILDLAPTMVMFSLSLILSPSPSLSLCRHSRALTQTQTSTSHTLISLPLSSSSRIIRTKVQQPPGQTGSVSAHNLGKAAVPESSFPTARANFTPLPLFARVSQERSPPHQSPSHFTLIHHLPCGAGSERMLEPLELDVQRKHNVKC